MPRSKNHPPDDQLLAANEVAELLSTSERHVRRLAEADLLPRPVPVGLRQKRWRRSEIMAWIDAGGLAGVRS